MYNRVEEGIKASVKAFDLTLLSIMQLNEQLEGLQPGGQMQFQTCVILLVPREEHASDCQS